MWEVGSSRQGSDPFFFFFFILTLLSLLSSNPRSRTAAPTGDWGAPREVGKSVGAGGAPSRPLAPPPGVGTDLGAPSSRRGRRRPTGLGLRLPPPLAPLGAAPPLEPRLLSPLPWRPRSRPRRRRAPSSLAAAPAAPPNFPRSRRR